MAEDAPEKATAEIIAFIKKSLAAQFADMYGFKEYTIEEADNCSE